MSSSALYTPFLTTLDHVRRHRRLSAAQTTDDALLWDLLGERSAEFATMVGRGPLMPYNAPKRFSDIHQRGIYDLRFADDLLAVTTITNADASAIASGYVLRPDDVYPRWCIELTQAGGQRWAFVNREDRVLVAGIWGYAPHFATCWKPVTTLGAAISDAAVTSVTVASGTAVEVGAYLLVESEQLFVTARASNVLTVERGANGTTAAAHSNGVPVAQYEQLRDIAAAVREMVVYDYLRKDQVGGRVTVYQGGVVEVNEMDPVVQTTAKRHMRAYAPVAI